MFKKVEKLLEWQPSAVDIRAAGECPNCKQDSLLFYDLRGNDRRLFTQIVESEVIRGGFYCVRCEFGAAGAMYREDYDRAEVYSVNEGET